MSKQIIIESRILHDWDFCAMCLLKLYELQTDDEQEIGDTQHDNGAGFNKTDAVELSTYAELLKAGTGKFTDHTKTLIGRKMVKYAGQLSKLLTEDEATM